MKEPQMAQIAELLHRVATLAVKVQKKCDTEQRKKLVDFLAVLDEDKAFSDEITLITTDVEALALSFPMPGMALGH